MASRIKQEEKSLPGLNFILFLKIPIKIDISSTVKFKYALEDKVSERNLEISEALRKILFDEFRVNNEKELFQKLKKNQPEAMAFLLKKVSDEIKQMIDEELKIMPRKRSPYFINKCKEIYFK